MILYERVTFFMVTGTLGLLVMAVLAATLGIIFSLFPIIPSTISSAILGAMAWVQTQGQRTRTVYTSCVPRVQRWLSPS
ncbi:MAG: hypothetical protein AB202_00525 [Parcubacteria bacterium C7867-007]|nr:MAG: hypothetical protein AB202_00525 [Parcubacteria bacterium C7867-007]